MHVFIPDGISFSQAAPKITHLGIGAHQDDLEIMALHGILECYQKTDAHFGGIVCTSGSGSPRSGRYAHYSNEAIKECRREEQEAAARLGEYLFVTQLDYSSLEVQNFLDTPHDSQTLHNPLSSSLYELLKMMRPKVIYMHHPLDKHPTHRTVFLATLAALRRLPKVDRPLQLLGGEVWRGLDWITDQDKVTLDVSSHPELSQQLLSVFDSQISGGKRYDLATLGRHWANATYATPHAVDQATQVAYAVDLSPLIEDDNLDIQQYALGFVDRFREEIATEVNLLKNKEIY